MARYRPDAFSGCRTWQKIVLVYSQAASHGKISPRCVHEGASDKKNASSWQHIACMYSKSAIFGKICVACIRKAPQSAVGEYTARASCRQGAFSPSEALKSCTAHKSCHPLMSQAPCRDDLPYGPCSRTLLNAWPLRKDAHPPAPRQYLPPAVPPLTNAMKTQIAKNDFGSKQ